MSTRIKNILQKLGLIVLLIGAIFGTIQAPTAQAAEESYSISQLTNFTADCGSIWSTGNDGDSFMKYGIACILSTIAQILIIGLLYAVGAFFALLLTGFAYASMAMIKLGVVIITKIGAISLGFKMALGVTNLLFVIAIILIAFSTILRWHEYEAKKLLPRLIFAALLVNFSLLIAGVMLDASNVFTNYFTSHFDVNHIGKALDPQKQIFDAPPGEGDVVKDSAGNIIPNKRMYRLGGGEHSWEHFFVLFPRALFAMLITFFMMMAMVAVFIMALVRNIWVVVLLITMPLAWGSWVIPKLEGYWKKWWENFINWGVLYLPIVTFFLFLGYRTLDFKKAVIGDVIPNASQSSGIGSFLNSALSEAIGSLIVIGIILAGLKIAQSMGSTIAGAFAGLAGRGGRRLAGGLIKTSAAVPFAVMGGLAGVGRGLWKAATLKGAKTEAWENPYNPDDTRAAETAKPSLKARFKAGLGGFTGSVGYMASGGFIPTNLYGRATSGLSTWAAGLSFLPGFGTAAEFFGKTSAAQREAINRAAAGYDNLSEAGRNAKYKAMEFGSATDQAGAMLAAEKNHDHLPGELAGKFADVVTAFYPGVARKEISLLKEMAGHDPFNAKAISGESAEDVFKRADGEMARKWDMSHWNSSNITMALKSMNDSIKRAAASKNDFNRNLMLTHAINRLGDISVHMNDEQKKSMSGMLSDFAAVRSGTANADIMNRLEGHLEKLSDTDNKDIRGKFAAEQRTALNFGKDIARVITGVKSKSEHGSHGNLRDFEVRNMIHNGLSGAFAGLLGNVKSAAAAGAAQGHGGGGSHATGGH